MDDSNTDLVTQFMYVTHCDERIAIYMLDLFPRDLNTALEQYFLGNVPSLEDIINKKALKVNDEEKAAPSFPDIRPLALGTDERHSSPLMNIDNRPKNVICVGNPGSGKSTLLNSMLERVDPQRRHKRFKSGVSIAEGLTFQLDTIKVGNTCFMDTPGLADVSKRKEAAKAIHDALKKGGNFQVLIVVTLESGRVKPQDAATAKVVLDSAPDITEFAIIFNKITAGVMRLLRDNSENVKKLLVEVQPKGNRHAVGYPFFLKNMAELADEPDISIRIPELEEFQELIPLMTISPRNVQYIVHNDLERVIKMMEKELEEMKKDRLKLQRKIEELEANARANVPRQRGGFLSKCISKAGGWLAGSLAKIGL